MIFSSSVFDVNGYLMWWNILIQHLFLNGVRYLEKVKACDDVAVVDMAALGWVCELTLWVSAWAAASLKLPTHLQRQPFNITHSRQSHWHFTHNASESVVLWRRVADGKSRGWDVNHTVNPTCSTVLMMKVCRKVWRNNVCVEGMESVWIWFWFMWPMKVFPEWWFWMFPDYIFAYDANNGISIQLY